MSALDALMAHAILTIPLDRPERLFSGDAGAVQRAWRGLVRRWHPDTNPAPDAAGVVAHINVLHDEAQRRHDAGVAERDGPIVFTARDGRVYRMRHRRAGVFDLGEIYIGRTAVAFAVRTEFRDLFENALATIRSFPFGSEAMRAEMRRFLPDILATVETTDRLVVVARSTPDLVRLEDLVEHLGGKLAATHVAWVVSALENLACWLDWAGLMHGAILPGTVFVSPQRHIQRNRGFPR